MVRSLGYLGVIASTIALTLGAPAQAQDPRAKRTDSAPDPRVLPRSQTRDAAADDQTPGPWRMRRSRTISVAGSRWSKRPCHGEDRRAGR